jgi:hypothetical protein
MGNVVQLMARMALIGGCYRNTSGSEARSMRTAAALESRRRASPNRSAPIKRGIVLGFYRRNSLETLEAPRKACSIENLRLPGAPFAAAGRV